MKCATHCPPPPGLPWRWILLAIALVLFAAAATWFSIKVGRVGLVLIGVIPAIIVIGALVFIVDCAIQNTRRAKEAKLPWRSTPLPAALSAMFDVPRIDAVRVAKPEPVGSAASSTPTRRLTLISGGLDDDGTGNSRVA